MQNAMHVKKLAVFVLFAGAPAAAQCDLSAALAGFKNTPDGGTAFFDVAVTSWPIEIHRLALNVSSGVGTSFDIDVYTTPGSFVGKETDPTQWTRRARGAGRSTGPGTLSITPLTNRIALDANSSQGMAIVITRAGGHRYENGNGANEFFENEFVSIRMGSVTFGAFGPSAFSPRVWNGTILYNSPVCSCPCACDFNTAHFVVCDLFDFLAFQGAFVNGEACACDMDTSTGVGVCDLFDFLEFQSEFVEGCP